MVGEDLFDQSVHLSFIGNVAGIAFAAEFGCRGLHGGLAQIREHHGAGALGQESFGHGAPNAAAPPRDHRNLPLKLHAHLPPDLCDPGSLAWAGRGGKGGAKVLAWSDLTGEEKP